MGVFKESEGEVAILVRNGVWMQVPIYTRDGYLYGKISGGFIRLNSDKSTSATIYKIDAITWTGKLGRDKLGRLCEVTIEGSTPLGPHNLKALGLE